MFDTSWMRLLVGCGVRLVSDRRIICVEIRSENEKGRLCLGDLRRDGRIMLK